jgi:cell division septation protein DedD
VIYYAQVSSTSNLDWAQDEITRLNQAGLPAELIPQTEFDDRYRVGLGPFRTREEAEETGRILGRAFFVVTIGARENQ